MVTEVLTNVSFESEHMDMFLAFLERLLKISKLKYVVLLIIMYRKSLKSKVYLHDFKKFWSNRILQMIKSTTDIGEYGISSISL